MVGFLSFDIGSMAQLAKFRPCRLAEPDDSYQDIASNLLEVELSTQFNSPLRSYIALTLIVDVSQFGFYIEHTKVRLRLDLAE